jgi:hypothetical protein
MRAVPAHLVSAQAGLAEGLPELQAGGLAQAEERGGERRLEAESSCPVSLLTSEKGSLKKGARTPREAAFFDPTKKARWWAGHVQATGESDAAPE